MEGGGRGGKNGAANVANGQSTMEETPNLGAKLQALKGLWQILKN